MNEKINDLVGRIKALEKELETELDQTRAEILFRLENKKIRFEQDMLARHRQFKTNLFRYALFPKWQHVVTAPLIYALLPILLLLDLFASLYHAVCFPLLGIPKVKRSDYLIFDRRFLAYLNLLEMVNCVYCSYGNGLISYLKEIVARTEQYWCPIKHAQRILDAHTHYRKFVEYGDAEAFRHELDSIRRDF